MATPRARLVSTIQIIVGGNVVAAGLATYFGNEAWYKRVVMPLGSLFLEPEAAHRFVVKVAACGLLPRSHMKKQPELSTQVFGLQFKNPIGLAAGFDKHAEAIDGLLKVGFGFVEVGSVTPRPQEGNPKPRVFRLTNDNAVINRYGFNSDGHDAVAARLQCRKQPKQEIEVPDDRNMLNENLWSPWRPKFLAKKCVEEGVLGVNLGRNKDTPEGQEAEDYVAGVKTLGPHADYLVINVSSPNTAGLRNLQRREQLQNLLMKVSAERDRVSKQIGRSLPLLVKVAPDLNDDEKADIASVVLASKSRVDGLIVTNTTISRPASLVSAERNEVGGLSGSPLKDLSTQTIRDLFSLTNGQIPIVGVGGVSSGSDAYDKIKAGACLIQIYTALVYAGPPVVANICIELAELLRRDGFKSVSEAVGVDNRRR